MKKIQKGNDIYIRWNITKNKDLQINNPKVLLFDAFKKEQDITFDYSISPIEEDEMNELIEVNVQFKAKNQKTCGKYVLKFVNFNEDTERSNTLYVSDAFVLQALMNGVIEDGIDESVHTIVGYELESILNPSAFVDMSPYYTKEEIDGIVGDMEELESDNLVDAIKSVASEGGSYTVGKESESIVSGGISYDLNIDNENKSISISKYSPVKVSLTADAIYEIDDTTKSRTVKATVSGTKSNQATLTWSNSKVGFEVEQTFSSPNKSTLTATVNDGRTSDSKTTTVKFVPAIMIGYSNDENLKSVDSSINGYHSFIQDSMTIDNYKITLTEAGYIYMATVNKPVGFYLSGTNNKADMSGGWIKTENTFTKYSTKETYNIYRTINKQSAGTYRVDFN